MDYEISDAQISYIIKLLDTKRISSQNANRIIEILLQEPPLSDDGMDTLKQIQRPA